MTVPLVLDTGGLDAVASTPPPAQLRAYVAEALARRAEVIVPAVVCAEACRGPQRTRFVESALARSVSGPATVEKVRVIPTDFALARQVGAILHAAASGSADLVDAHVVAVCLPTNGGVVITSDPDDIHRLAAVVPTVRIVTRRPDPGP